MTSTWKNVMSANAAADVLLWRNKKISGGVLGGATAIWILIELMESAAHIPDMKLDEKVVLQLASALRYELNRTLDVLREVALGRELKKFLSIIFGLWILSVLGSWCNFLTLLYIALVLLHTLPVLYEKYGHTIDSYAEKAMIELKKLYVVFDANVLSKIPRGALKDKKKA